MRKFLHQIRVKMLLLVILPLLFGEIAVGQISVTTTNTFLNNNGSGTVTFNLQNTNNFPIIIQEIHGVIGATTTANAEVYFNNTPLSGPPSAFTTANGWNLVASGTVSATANTTTTVTQPFFTGLSLIVPPSTTIGVAVFATSQRYFTHPGPVTIDSAGGVRIITGTNIGYGGNTPPTAPTINPRGWIGTIKFIPAIPCSGTPYPGNAITSSAVVCASQNFTLSLANDSIRQNLSYQWLSSSSGLPGTYSPMTNDTLRNIVKSQAATTWYRCMVSCGTSSDTSTAILVSTPVGSMSGAYTVNPALPVSSTNFHALQHIITAMNCNGITGPVTIDIPSSVGVLNEQISFGNITGTSASNTITINGHGNSILGTGSPLVSFSGTKFVIWDSLNIIGSSTFGGFGVYLGNISENITIRNSTINAGNTATGTANAGIVVSGSSTTATTAGNNAKNVTIENNRIIGGYYGITLMGTASYLNNSGHKILNNEIKDFYLYGIYLANTDTTLIEGNDISRLNRSVFTTFYGIYGTTTRNTKIRKNKIHDSGPGSYTAYPIYLTTSANTANFETDIINNSIYNITTTGTLYGIYLLGTVTHFRIFHNTVHDNTDGSTGARRNLFISVAPNNTIVRNNIFSMTGSGSGAKFNIYITTTSASFISNNNNFFMGATAGTNNMGYWTANRANLAAWTTATAFDANSRNFNPVFYNELQGNLLPLSGSIDSLGTNVGVLTDINGISRNATFPDAGAYEFVGVNSDLELTSSQLIYASGCSGTNDTLKVKIKNAIGSNLNLATTPIMVKYQITGPFSVTDSVLLNTGSLLTNEEKEFVLSGSINRSIPGNYQALVYIPYSTENNLTINDTIRFLAPPSISGNLSVTIGSGSYPTLQSLFDSLAFRGVCGPLNININPSAATFNSNVVIWPIPGASPTNKITINGKGNTITTAVSPMVRLNGAKHIIWDSLNLSPAAGFVGIGMSLGLQCDDITIQNSTINVGTTSTATTNAGIVFSGTPTTATTAGNNARNIKILNNQIIGGYYGISMFGEASYANNFGHVIKGNRIADFYLYGIYANQADGMIIDSNDINRATRGTVSTFYGYYGVSTRNVKLTRNKIHDAGLGSYTAYPIWFSTSVNNSGQESEIINNAVYNINTTGLTYGLYLSGTTERFKIYHNTIEVDGNGTGTKRAAFFSVAPNNVDVKNNILSVNGNGSGAKHVVYVTTTSGTFSSNNNALFMGTTTGTNAIGYWNTDQTTLAAWQTATGRDSLSSSSNPVFTDLANGNFTPLSINIDNIGTYVNVDTDINGNTRPIGTPDVGATEFTGVNGDIGLVGASIYRSSQCYSTSDTLKFTILNVIGATIDFNVDPCTIVYQISGPVPAVDSVIVNSGTLAANSSLTITNTNANLSMPGNYALNAYIRPNAVNFAQNNDTLPAPFLVEVKPILSVSPKTGIANSPTDTFILKATSPLFPNGGAIFTEVCHWRLATGAAPLGGWPAYMLADDYVEITGLPNASLAGYTMEEWTGTTLQHSVTFPTGTVFSPNGTMIIATGQLGSSVPSPSNFYYHSGNTVTHSSTGDIRGYILKSPSGTIVDVTTYGAYTFPAASGVTSADWTGSTPAVSSAGNKLTGPDINAGTNWVTAAGTFLQNPNAQNPGVPAPVPGSMTGFNWYFAGLPIDTNANIKVGPYTTAGIYEYVAVYSTVCGIYTDTVRITATANVPVLLSKFSASKVTDDVVLDWETSLEINNNYFEVERSLDNRNFTSIGKVKGHGNSSKLNRYQFIDANAIEQLASSASVYYRLRQVDFDGSFEYSPIRVVSLHHSNALQVSVQPNPNKGVFNLHLEGMNEDEMVRVELIDMFGNVVYQTEQNSANHTITIEANLAAGVYTAIVKAGENFETIRVLVQ
jgi:hypothetical protein